jgi:hypothetical protein
MWSASMVFEIVSISFVFFRVPCSVTRAPVLYLSTKATRLLYQFMKADVERLNTR